MPSKPAKTSLRRDDNVRARSDLPTLSQNIRRTRESVKGIAQEALAIRGGDRPYRDVTDRARQLKRLLGHLGCYRASARSRAGGVARRDRVVQGTLARRRLDGLDTARGSCSTAWNKSESDTPRMSVSRKNAFRVAGCSRVLPSVREGSFPACIGGKTS